MKQKFLSVTDSSATFDCPTREHQIFLNGEILTVSFQHGKATVLPYEIGLKFMLPGFTVKDAEDNELVIPTSEVDALAEDEVVAKLTELTDDSLMIRAISKVGGEQFMVGDQPSRSELIAFLMAGPAEAEKEEVVFDEDDLDNADVSDNVGSGLTAPTGEVPENSEDEITLDVGGDPVEEPAPEAQEQVAEVTENVTEAEAPAGEIVANDADKKAE